MTCGTEGEHPRGRANLRAAGVGRSQVRRGRPGLSAGPGTLPVVTAASLVLLGALTALSVGLYRELPPVRRMRMRAALALLVALVLLGGSVVLAWRAPPVTGWTAGVAAALALAAGVCAGGPVATAFLRLAERPAAPPGTPSPADPTILQGGTWIGLLERVAITGTILVGRPEGVAIALAVKGLGRYPELSGPAASERFIIGTFASVLWATGCAGAGWLLLR